MISVLDSPSLIECVPNFSEGRRSEVIDELTACIQDAADVHVLHRTSDHDHNRSVITFVGSPSAVQEAAFQAIALAAKRINLDEHQGAHPRLGATDVVPLVPLHGVTLEQCADFARELGKRVGTELQLPVYLYEAAATRPDRVALPDVRRGEYEALKQTIHLPERQPDFGPVTVGTAGAVIIGARPVLIAYNVFLNTDDVTIARTIASAIRYSSGGLAGVRALGLLVNGKAQVSMNLTDYKRTPVHRVLEMIRSEATRHGVSITHSELIGLIPQDALEDAAKWYLQLHDLNASQVLRYTHE
ncbi:MAG: glutamate formimidoyltransferase [Anaerolineae bacterium]|nr:glutamate formimidoyltransferase [Anaerolineae bacterium]